MFVSSSRIEKYALDFTIYPLLLGMHVGRRGMKGKLLDLRNGRVTEETFKKKIKIQGAFLFASGDSQWGKRARRWVVHWMYGIGCEKDFFGLGFLFCFCFFLRDFVNPSSKKLQNLLFFFFVYNLCA